MFTFPQSALDLAVENKHEKVASLLRNEMRRHHELMLSAAETKGTSIEKYIDAGCDINFLNKVFAFYHLFRFFFFNFFFLIYFF